MKFSYEDLQFFATTSGREFMTSALAKADQIYKEGFNPIITWLKGVPPTIIVEKGDKVTAKNDTGNFTKFKTSMRLATAASRERAKKQKKN